MKKFILISIIIVSSLFLGGCSLSMSNDDIIKEIKKCNDAGLEAKILFSGFDEVTNVICLPKN